MKPSSEDTGTEPLRGLLNEVDEGCSLFDAPVPAVSSNASRLFADLDGGEDFVPDSLKARTRPSTKASCASGETGGVDGRKDGPFALDNGFGYPAAPKKRAVRHMVLPVVLQAYGSTQRNDQNLQRDDAADEATAQWNEMQHAGWRPVMPAWHRDPSEISIQEEFSRSTPHEASEALSSPQIVLKECPDSEEDEEIEETQLPEHEHICIGFKDIDQWSDHDGEASTCSMSDDLADDKCSELDAAMLESELIIGYRADVGCGDGFPEENDSEAPDDKQPSEVCDEETCEITEEEDEVPQPLPPPPPQKVDHVVLVVHGIGATDEVLAENIQNVRETLEAVKRHWFWHVDINVHVEMIDWKCSVCEQQASIFEKITPHDARETRMTLNATLSDVIYYKTAHHRQLILDTVMNKMNSYVKELRMDPSGCFLNSQISVIGHSLGSVILYDVFTGWNISEESSTPTLDFKVENFFLWGSPVAAMVSIANFDATQGEFTLPADINVYNIFHPHDPIAFRLEPLCYHDQDSVPPETLQYWENNGTRPDKDWVRSYEYAKEVTMEKWAEVTKRFWKALGSGTESANYWVRQVRADQMFRFTLSSSRNSGPSSPSLTDKKNIKEEEGDPEEKVKRIPEVRLDFALQEHAAEAIVEQYGLMQSHSCYWTSKDVALFVLKKLTQHELSPYPADPENCKRDTSGEKSQYAMWRGGENKKRPLTSVLGLECLGRRDED